MASIAKSALVRHRAQSMFALVADIESYPEFLPWCAGARILSREDGKVTAAIDIRFHGIGQSFTTINRQVPYDRIDIQLVEGPFSQLEGGWRFTPLGVDACKVELELEYDFNNFLLAKLIGPVFHQIATSMVESFVKRADVLADKAVGNSGS